MVASPMLPEKIDVSPVIADHLATLRDQATGRRRVFDLLLFFGVPFVVAGLAIFMGIRIRISAVSSILTASALFIGLLPNLLILVLTFLTSTKGDPSDGLLQQRKTFMKEIAIQTSFSFLLSLILAALTATALVLLPKDDQPIGATLTFLIIGVSIALLLVLLMMIRRMHILIVTEFDRHKFRNAA